MSSLLSHLRARPRLGWSIAIGTLAGVAVPEVTTVVGRLLVGWNAAVWLYIALTLSAMLRADHDRMRHAARVHSEGLAIVSTVIIGAAIASFAAIVLELAAGKASGGSRALSQVLFTLATVAGSWLLVPVLFTQNYASRYYGNEHHGGLQFPGLEASNPPDYLDFLYFSFTIAVASQTADVVVTSRPMRRLVLTQSVLSFVFNTTILALTINIAAGLF